MKLPVIYDEIPYNKKWLVRKEYVRVQNGDCYHCGAPLNDVPTEVIMKHKITTKLYPDGFFDNPVHLHHSYDTGLTIGAVHAYCNAVLWEYHGE